MQSLGTVTIADLSGPVQTILPKFEVFDGAGWLDLYDLGGKCYVKKDSIRLSLGGAGMSPDPIAAKWSAEIHNEDGIFHPFHPTSEYADLFRIGRAARISLGGMYPEQDPEKWLVGWAERKRPTIRDTYLDEDLEDFRLCVKIVGDAHIGAKARADGFDIRFTKDDGVTLLPFQREFFEVDGEGKAWGTFWVKTDARKDGPYPWIYYGNPTAPDVSSGPAVFDTEAAVYHMNDLTDSTIADSSANANDGTKKAANEPIEADGKIGKGQDYDGVNDYVATTVPPLSNFTTCTISFWVNLAKLGQGTTQRYIDAGWWGNGRYVIFGSATEQTIYLGFRNDAGTEILKDRPGVTGQWIYIVARWNGTNINFAANNSWGAPTVFGGTVAGAATRVGQYTFCGVLDEVRFSETVRSDAWHKFEYWNQLSDDGELDWGDAVPPITRPAPYYWQRLIGYMDAPRFEHGSRSVSLSGLDYMKRLADTVLRDEQGGGKYWGDVAVFDTVVTFTPIGPELYTWGDALDPENETDSINANWQKSANAVFVSEPGPPHLGAFSITSGSEGWVKHMLVASLTQDKRYVVKVRFYNQDGNHKIELAQTSYQRHVLTSFDAVPSGRWVEREVEITAAMTGNLEFRIDGSEKTPDVDFYLDYISIHESQMVRHRYDMPEGCNGPHWVELDNQDGLGFAPLFQGDEVDKKDGSGGGWFYNENDNEFYFDENKLIREGTDNLKVYYYTTHNLDDVLADLLVEAGYYATRDAALSAMNYTPTDISIPRVWFDSGTAALAAVKLICERVDYRFRFDEEGVPRFHPPSEPGEELLEFGDGDLKGSGVFQDIGTVRNRIVIEGAERAMFRARDDKDRSKWTGEASDGPFVGEKLEKTHNIKNHLFQDQASIDAMCAALLAAWKDPKWYAELKLDTNPIPLERGDTVGIKILLNPGGEEAHYVDRAVIIRDISIDGPRASYKVEVIP